MTRPDDIGPWAFTPADRGGCPECGVSALPHDVGCPDADPARDEVRLHRALDRGLKPSEVVALGILPAATVEYLTGWPCEVTP